MANVAVNLKFTPERRLELRRLLLESKKNKIDEESFSYLDSSLKKNTAFVKKCRSVTVESFDSICREFEQLKLTKYLSEAAESLAANRLKNAQEIMAVLEVVAKFSARYWGEFVPAYLGALIREVNVEFGAADDPQTWFTRQRQLLRLQAELYLVGIQNDIFIIHKQLRNLLPMDDSDGPPNITIATSFVKAVGFYFVKDLLGGDSNGLISEDWKEKFTNTLTSYFKAMSRNLVRRHQALQGLETSGRQFYETRGDLSESRSNKLIEAHESFEKLKVNLEALAEQLNLSLPELGTSSEAPKVVGGKIVFSDPSFLKEEFKSVIFETEEERSIYEDVIDLKERLPNILLQPQPSDGFSGVSSPIIANESTTTSAEDLSAVKDIDPESLESSIEKSSDLDDPVLKGQANVKAFFEKLQEMQSCDLADQMAMEFCYVNGKTVRRKLSDVLITLPNRRLELLPFIGRFLATIKPYFPEVSTSICDSLRGQFLFLFHRKEPILGTRSRICRFIGELTKFGVMPQGTTYAMLKKCIIEDLSTFNIDMASILMETCGRYLYHQPESHKRIQNLIEVISKKKQTVDSKIDQHYSIMLDNAIYMTNPPRDAPERATKPKDPQFEYMKRLLRMDLSAKNAESIFRKVRLFDWYDNDTQNYLYRVFLKSWKTAHGSIPLLASMMGAIVKLYPSFAVRLIDGLLEEIRWCLEARSNKYNHRLFSSIRYLGEFYCFAVIEMDVIMIILHQLISLGHPQGVPRVTMPSTLDPPDNHFRIRLICTLLTTCGSFLLENNMDYSFKKYMALFEYYQATKVKSPMDIDYLLADTYDELGFSRPTSPVSVRSAVERLMEVTGDNSLLILLKDLDETGYEEEWNKQANIPSAHPLFNPEENTSVPSVLLTREDEFDRALSGLVSLSMDERKLEKRATVFDAPLPLLSRNSLLSTGNGGPILPSSPGLPAQGASPSGVSVKLLLKKKNKPTAKELRIDPDQASFLQHVLTSKEQREAESAEMRDRVLHLAKLQESTNQSAMGNPEAAPSRQKSTLLSSHRFNLAPSRRRYP